MLLATLSCPHAIDRSSPCTAVKGGCASRFSVDFLAKAAELEGEAKGHDNCTSASRTEKSTRWTDAGLDQNFQRALVHGWLLVSHHCCDHCRATQCRAHGVAALQKGPPFHGSQSSREIKHQNARCQTRGREVTRR